MNTFLEQFAERQNPATTLLNEPSNYAAWRASASCHALPFDLPQPDAYIPAT